MSREKPLVILDDNSSSREDVCFASIESSFEYLVSRLESSIRGRKRSRRQQQEEEAADKEEERKLEIELRQIEKKTRQLEKILEKTKPFCQCADCAEKKEINTFDVVSRCIQCNITLGKSCSFAQNYDDVCDYLVECGKPPLDRNFYTHDIVVCFNCALLLPPLPPLPTLS